MSQAFAENGLMITAVLLIVAVTILFITVGIYVDTRCPKPAPWRDHAERTLTIPTPDQIKLILGDYFMGCAPEVHARCAQSIFNLCVVTSGLPIIPSDNRVKD